MKVGVQAHHWSRVLFFYMGLLAASVKGEFPVMLNVVLLPCARHSWRLHTTLLRLTCGWSAVIVNYVPFNVGSYVSLMWIYASKVQTH